MVLRDLNTSWDSLQGQQGAEDQKGGGVTEVILERTDGWCKSQIQGRFEAPPGRLTPSPIALPGMVNADLLYFWTEISLWMDIGKMRRPQSSMRAKRWSV